MIFGSYTGLLHLYLRYRLLGLSMAMAIGPLAEVSAYAFAPQSLLAPLDGFDVIWNILPKTQVAGRLPKTQTFSSPADAV